MSSHPRRITGSLDITGQSQSVAMDLTIGRINQIIIASTVDQHNFDFKLTNEKGDIIYGPTNVTCPSNVTRPDMLPIGKATVTITNLTTVSGTVTIVFLVEERG